MNGLVQGTSFCLETTFSGINKDVCERWAVICDGTGSVFWSFLPQTLGEKARGYREYSNHLEELEEWICAVHLVLPGSQLRWE